MSNINEDLGKLRTKRLQHTCDTCGAWRLHRELNWEGNVHHGTPVQCIDRKACERRRRRLAR